MVTRCGTTPPGQVTLTRVWCGKLDAGVVPTKWEFPSAMTSYTSSRAGISSRVLVSVTMKLSCRWDGFAIPPAGEFQILTRHRNLLSEAMLNAVVTGGKTALRLEPMKQCSSEISKLVFSMKK